MFPGEYTLYEETGSLIVEWMKPVLPIEMKVISLLFLAVMPLLFIFRGAFARFADRHLHIHASPKVFGVLAPSISLVCGALLIFARDPQAMTYWNFGTEGLSVKNPNGIATLPWTEVDSVAYDDQSPEKATLVLKSSGGKKVTLVLSWIYTEHQDKILEFIRQATHQRFSLPAVEGPDEETDDDEVPWPIKPRKQ